MTANTAVAQAAIDAMLDRKLRERVAADIVSGVADILRARNAALEAWLETSSPFGPGTSERPDAS